MKRKTKRIAKAVGLGLGPAAFSATMLTGCDLFHPSQQEIAALYGPPPGYQQQEYDPSNDEPEDVYGPPSDFYHYAPEEDIPEPLYGPPPEDYYPEDDSVECVYGPPEELGIDEPDF